MDELEKYIKDNIHKFNEGKMPQGHKEEFMNKINELENKKIGIIGFRRIIRYTSLAVAAIAIAFIIKNISINKSDSAIEVINYEQILEQQEKEILSLTKEMDPETFVEMKNTMNIILYESIPLSEQLPDELSDEEKMEILREYYKEKSNALKSLRLLYAQETNPID